ncbi:MAG: phosphoribosylformylglycinamidine cyclo-ligase [bacterium]|nr:phosphoribosylformylglycinamidine cyclo-ligase [bacterium]
MKKRQRGTTYADSGVRLDANAGWVDSIRSAMTSTFGPRVLSPAGGFAGCFELDFDQRLFRRNYRRPLLVGCTDGVGTKVLLGIKTGRLRGLGIDLVAMSVNDLITVGAEPLFFLDYLAVNRLEPKVQAAVIEGVADGCRQAGCALLGGETAEMPDLYAKDHFDLAGFAVGVVEYRRRVDPSRVTAGDVLVGLPSSGPHSNGYSLIRKLVARRNLEKVIPELGESLADALMRPTRIYTEPVRRLLAYYRVKRVVTALAHITGGGLPENVARILPPDCDAAIETDAWSVPAVFDVLADCGVDRQEMYRVFNMGIGYVLAIRPAYANGAMRVLRRAGEQPSAIGRVTSGRGRVVLVS